MPDARNVKRLVQAAWAGIEAELLQENSSAEDVINATIAIAAGGIKYACSAAAGRTPEEILHNKLAVRSTLYKLLMDTTDDLKVQ